MRKINALVAAALMALAVVPATADAQARIPSRADNVGMVAGFGSVGYTWTQSDSSWQNAFEAAISPIFLFKIGDDLLVQSELELGFHDEGTELMVEYAQVDYLGFEKWQLTAGKFLLPFGIFGERIHPSWINKLPGRPITYGEGHGGEAGEGILPILSDVGFMARRTAHLTPRWALDLSAYVTNGPSMGMDMAMPGAPPSAPDVAYATTNADINRNKMVGGRIGLVGVGGFEAYLSAYQAKYDKENTLSVAGSSVAFDYRRGQFQVRGEGMTVSQQFDAAGMRATLKSPGYWLQLSQRFGAYEPVLQWSQLMDAKADGMVMKEGREQAAVGLVYWLATSVPVKLAYEFNQSTSDRLMVQWAFGF